MTKRDAARGGRARTERKLAALAKIHAKRRGVPIHPDEPAIRRLAALHVRGLDRYGRNRNPAAYRKIAELVEVSARSVKRWLTGHERPNPKHHHALSRAVTDIQSQFRKL